MSKDLVKKIDLLKNQRGTNRTKEVVRAVEFLVESVECPHCKTLNSNKGVYCSVCGEKLVNTEEYQRRANKIMNEFALQAEGVNDDVSYILSYNLTPDDELPTYSILIIYIEGDEPLIIGHKKITVEELDRGELIDPTWEPYSIKK